MKNSLFFLVFRMAHILRLQYFQYTTLAMTGQPPAAADTQIIIEAVVTLVAGVTSVGATMTGVVTGRTLAALRWDTRRRHRWAAMDQLVVQLEATDPRVL
jgi:hypothetical protein